MSVMVVKKKFVSNTPREDGVYVEIVARGSGLFAWLLTLMRIDASRTFQIYYDRVVVDDRSLFSHSTAMVPSDKISVYESGYSKPWTMTAFLLLATFFLARLMYELKDFWWALGLAVAGILIAIMYFFLSKRLYLEVIPDAGKLPRLQLQRSFIEGQEVSERSLGEIVKIATVIANHRQDWIRRMEAR
jgi:hypothetical protein